MPDTTLSTLANIRTKVRRLTRAPSSAQLTDADIDQYVNTFVLYDFPEHLRLFSLRTTFTFFAQPYIDTYETTNTTPTDPLYNFKNKYISVHPPIYIGGYDSFYSQSREQFFGIYPFINFVQQIGTGDGSTTTFTGTITNGPILQNNVLFDSLDANNGSIVLEDVPRVGSLIGDLVVPNAATSYGTINYVTGAYDFTFPVTPGAGAVVNSQTVPYVPSRPLGMLFYDDKFTLRPVPDQAYRINMEVYIRPTELLDSTQSPELAQWWQYIAYGAAKKVFEDRMDMDSVQMILPEYKKQEALVLRKTIVQLTNERTATIYTEQTGMSGFGGGWGFGGGLY